MTATRVPMVIHEPPEGWAAARRAPSTRLPTASLVLGIVAMVANVLLIPTVLAIVFGSIGLAKGTRAKGRAIAGIVLGALGVVALGVQAAVVIPIYIGVQNQVRSATVGSSVSAVIADQAAQQGVTLTDLVCPEVGGPVQAGDRIECTADRAGVGPIRIDVTFTDASGAFTFQTAGAAS